MQQLDGIGQTRLFGGGGVAPGLPSDISGLLFWFKTPISGATNNASITTWPDSSGNGRDGTPGGTGLLYRTGVVNSLPVVENGGDYLGFTSTNLGTAHSVFIVFRPLAGFSDGVLIGGSASGKYTPYLDGADLYYRAVGAEGFVTVAHGGLTSNTAYLLGIVRNGTSVSFYKNGSQLSTTQTLSVNTALAVQYIDGIAGSFNPSNSQIAEIFAFDTALSTDDRQAMESYISGRFAIF